MQNNYYFLKKLTPGLKTKLIGWRFSECYSQNRDELIIAFVSPANEEFFIRTLLRPDFTCLSFPENLHRAKKNSVDLFPELIDKKVKDIVQYQNERAFLIEFENSFSLLFKMHGNRSNIILFKKGIASSMFNNRLPNDLSIIPEELDRPIDQTYLAFEQNDGDYKKLFPTFGKEIGQYLDMKGYSTLSTEKQWTLIMELLTELNNDVYYIVEEGLPKFMLFKDEEKEYRVFTDPFEAISVFYVTWLSRYQFETEKASLVKSISADIKKDEAYIKSTSLKLEKLESESNYRQWADLIMANLHQIDRGEKEVVVENFYNENQPVTIKLNNQLSPQKNAERFYQKAKNQHKEMEVHLQGLLKREDSLKEKYAILKQIEDTEDIKSLKAFSPKKAGKKQVVEIKPFHHFNIQGYDVLVGKNARSNDQLLQQFTKKDDLWLHARDVSGSHVVIKVKGNEKIPEDVIEKAAKLAAYNSKRRSDSLCPVIVTQRKYVRKRKGDPPGAVVVDREEVIMVEPSLDV